MPLKNLSLRPGQSIGPYSDIVVVDDRQLYLSGLIAQDLDSQEVRYGTIEEETRTILENLSTILRAHDSDMEHVIRADVLLKDFSLRDRMNAEYLRHFKPGHLPARICYGNVALHGECKLEVCVIAAKRGS